MTFSAVKALCALAFVATAQASYRTLWYEGCQTCKSSNSEYWKPVGYVFSHTSGGCGFWDANCNYYGKRYECNPGYRGSWTSCYACGVNQYSTGYNTVSCAHCPSGKWTAGNTASTFCVDAPTKNPTTKRPTTKNPTTKNPTKQPTKRPTTENPTKQPTKQPTDSPTYSARQMAEKAHLDYTVGEDNGFVYKCSGEFEAVTCFKSSEDQPLVWEHYDDVPAAMMGQGKVSTNAGEYTVDDFGLTLDTLDGQTRFWSWDCACTA